jgi:hypothetical protein
MPSLLFAFGALAVGCKTKCPDPGRIGDDIVHDDTVASLQKAAEKDRTICKELAHPRIVLTGPNVVLTGTKEHDLATRASMPANEMKRVEPLHERLKDFRELRTRVHPSREFPGEVDVHLDPDLETARALSVLRTAIFTGYTKLHVVAGPTVLDVDWALPLPPPSPDAEEVFTVTLASTDNKTFDVKLSSSKCAELATAKAPSAELAAGIARVCAGRPPPCAGTLVIVVPMAPPFGDVAKLARDTLAALAAPKPRLLLGTEFYPPPTDPCPVK